MHVCMYVSRNGPHPEVFFAQQSAQETDTSEDPNIRGQVATLFLGDNRFDNRMISESGYDSFYDDHCLHLYSSQYNC